MTRKSEILTIVLFCSFLAVFSVLFLFMPDMVFSEQENRDLAQFPEFTEESFFSGKFSTDMNEYFADQFPLRNLFVKIKSGFELTLLKGENNGVIYKNDQLAVKDFEVYQSLGKTQNTDHVYPELIKAQLGSVNKLSQKLDIPVVTVIPPRVIDITDGLFEYDRPDGDIAFDVMKETLCDEAGYIDILPLLREKYENGEYVYYRTDHHWTTLGAYYAYCEIMAELGCKDKIIPIEDFEIEQIENYSGTTASKGNFPFYKKDVLEIWKTESEVFDVIIDGEKKESLYNCEYLTKNDKYSVFLDGTHDVTEIRKNAPDRKTVVVAKDSFANCLIPFLAEEFDIIALNLNAVSSVSAYAERYNADAVLIVYNLENIITSTSLSKIN